MAIKIEDDISEILQKALSSIPMYESKELNKVSENILKAIEVIVSDLIDVFGAEEFNSISRIFDKISKMPPSELEKSYKKIFLHSKFKIFNKDYPIHRYNTSEFPHTDIYNKFVIILDSINHMKSGHRYEPIKNSIMCLENICQDDNHKKRKKNFEIAEKIANFCLNEIDGSFPGFTTTKYLRYISIMEVIKENEQLVFDVREEKDILNVFNFIQNASILSVVLCLTDDKKNFIEDGEDGIRLLMKYVSNIQAMLNVGRKRWDLYEVNAKKVHVQFQKILKTNSKANINRFIEQYCKEKEENILLNDKELKKIQREIQKTEDMEKSDAKTKLTEFLKEKEEDRISGLKTHQIITSAKLKNKYHELYGEKTRTDS